MPRKCKYDLSRGSSRARAAKVARNQESSAHAELRRQQQQSDKVYFIGDEQNEVSRRCQYIEVVERDTVLKIQRMLHSHNLLLNIFKSAIEDWPSDNYKVVIHADRTPRGELERRYNAPMVNEVAVLVTGDPCSTRDIVFWAHDNTLKRVADTHKFYDVLQYSLILKREKYLETSSAIEWQKRGLPHEHILIGLKEKLLPNDIDNIISAEITDPQEDKYLYDTVIKNMIHGPCGTCNPGSPCMKNGKGIKKYPREMIRKTVHSEKGNPFYIRRAPEDDEMLLKIGDSCLDVDEEGYITFSREFCEVVENDVDLIADVFPELQQNLRSDQWEKVSSYLGFQLFPLTFHFNSKGYRVIPVKLSFAILSLGEFCRYSSRRPGVPATADPLSRPSDVEKKEEGPAEGSAGSLTVRLLILWLQQT
ncbi:hypothetical protein EVAR_63739_1 [Eumeta japonica]|uniref:Helitron helicase-like domain-containing protein n=1 Tax=Eumeta variegata TaxID=151549 RepID=A0A4C1ZTH8_EUMVA|nr:hypothetical protein EVAR_63739_1 [Eumeta japonica]